MKYFFLPIFILMPSMMNAQTSTNCLALGVQLEQALQQQDMIMVKYAYEKKLFTCGIKGMDKKSIADFYNKNGYAISWNNNHTFMIHPLKQDKYPQIEGFHTTYYYAKENTSVLTNDEIYKLRKGSDIIIDNAAYISVINPHDYPIFQVEDINGDKQLVDIHGQPLLATIPYDAYHLQSGFQVIIMHSGHSGVYNLLQRAWTIPMGWYTLQQVYTGYYMYNEGDGFVVLDDKNNVVSKINAHRIRPLDQGKLLVIQADHKMGVVDILGKEILPAHFDNIEIDYFKQILKVYKGSTFYYVDLDGKKM